ncbi:hypothetical protein Syun_025592 [Stephania yunnanensis]|uniref:Uncharacterized protein n=1 Tax=Stephania yunnanensis TaxID=152371 RepID=A0AAP0HV01_9MAGN
MWRGCGGDDELDVARLWGGRRVGRGRRVGTTAVVRPAAVVARQPKLRGGWLDGGGSNCARMAWRDNDIVRREEKKKKMEKKTFARHEISKGEFELMTPLKSW